MVFATSFAVLLSLNPYKHEPPVCDATVGLDLELDADGDQLRVFGAVVGIDATKASDPTAAFELRPAALLDPADVRHASTELTAAPGTSLGGTPQWAVVSLDTFSAQGPIEIPGDGTATTVALGEVLLTASLQDPTDPNGPVLLQVEHPSLLASKVSLFTDEDGDGSFDAEVVATPTRQAQSARLELCGDGVDEGDTVTANIDIGGNPWTLSRQIQREIARLKRVVVHADGVVEVQALEANPGDVNSAVFTHTDSDGNVLSVTELPAVATDVAFSSGWLSAQDLTVSGKAFARAARRGLDGVYDALAADATWLDVRLVRSPLTITVDGVEAALTTSPKSDPAWNDTLLAADHLEVEWFDTAGRPATVGPVRLDRSYLATLLMGSGVGGYTFDDGHGLDVSLSNGNGEFVHGQTVYFRVGQFGEILIDGVIWEVE